MFDYYIMIYETYIWGNLNSCFLFVFFPYGRFLHHVLSYRGPTLTFLRGDEGALFCLGGTSEWRESHQFWGGEDTIILQLLPLYKVINRKYFCMMDHSLLIVNIKLNVFCQYKNITSQVAQSPCIWTHPYEAIQKALEPVVTQEIHLLK